MSFFLKEEFAKGTITRKRNKIIYIIIKIDNCTSSLKKCDSGCGACGNVKESEKVTIYVPDADNYQIGSEITFKYFAINDALMTALAFGLPICSALIVIALWFFYAPAKVESPFALFTAGIGFAFGLFLIWSIDILLRRYFPATILKLSQKPLTE